jgi:DNA-binding NarL/FixJ family response regulator
LSNSEIAEQLHMSGATANTHVSRLLMKLAARDRAQLVVVAYQGGLARASAVADENASRGPGRT